MSGPASVPAAIIAAYADDWVARTFFGVTMFACAWFAAYRVWLAEREKLTEANKNLSKKADAAELRSILNELFNKSQRLCSVKIVDDYTEDQWEDDVNALMLESHDKFKGRISDIDLNLLLNSPMGMALAFQERTTQKQIKIQHFVHYYRDRLINFINKL